MVGYASECLTAREVNKGAKARSFLTLLYHMRILHHFSTNFRILKKPRLFLNSYRDRSLIGQTPRRSPPLRKPCFQPDKMALRALPSRNYWELARYEFVKKDRECTTQRSQRKRMAERHLLTHGAIAPGKATLERLMELVRRVDRGLLIYDNCDTSELRNFADARAIQCPQIRKPAKMAMVALLERADDDAQFTRMLDLPPELRVRIYEYYFAGLSCYFGFGQDSGSAPFRHKQPPITLASRLLRQESLDVFYDRVAVLVDLSYNQDARSIGPTSLDLKSGRLADASAVLKSFRHLHFCITCDRRYITIPDWSERMLDIQIEMPKTSDSRVLVKISWRRSLARQKRNVVWHGHLAQAKSLIEGIAGRVADSEDDYGWCSQGIKAIAEVLTQLEPGLLRPINVFQ